MSLYYLLVTGTRTRVFFIAEQPNVIGGKYQLGVNHGMSAGSGYWTRDQYVASSNFGHLAVECNSG